MRPYTVFICHLNHLCLVRIASLQHLTPAVVNEGEGKGRQVPSEQPIVSKDPMGRAENMKFSIPKSGLAVGGGALSELVSLPGPKTDGWRSLQDCSNHVKYTTYIIFLPSGLPLQLFGYISWTLVSFVTPQGDVKCCVTKNCLVSMSVKICGRESPPNPYPLPPQKSKSQVLGQTNLFNPFLFETWFLCLALAVLDSIFRRGWPRAHRGLPVSVSLSARITGIHHQTWPRLILSDGRT